MRLSTQANYTLSGIGFGLAFPLAAWTLDIVVSELAFSPASIVLIHQTSFVHYVVDLAPFVLGVVFYFLGGAYQRVLNRNYFSSLLAEDPEPGTTSRFNLIMAVVAVLILSFLGTSSWYMQQVMKLQSQAEIGASLDIILKTSEQAAHFQLQEEQSHVRTWAATDQIILATQALLRQHDSRQNLVESPVQETLRTWFEPLRAIRGYQGFFIISREGINLASSRDVNIAETSELFQHHLNFPERVWQGISVLSEPHHAHVALRTPAGKLEKGLITIFVGAPIIDKSGQIVAALAFRLDPHVNLSPILRQARIGESGETYAFIREGEIFTQSRFEQQIDKYGIVFSDADGIRHLEVRNPGVNLILGEQTDVPRSQQPFTRMAISAMAGESGQDLEGYRDYRGVPVIGSWLWSDRLGFGMTTEIDVSEAYTLLNFNRRIVTIATFTLGVLILGFITLLTRYLKAARHSAHELRENEETSRLLLNSTGEAIYGIDLNGLCTFANQACLKLLGNQGEEELIGRNMHALIHHTHNDGTPYPVAECKIYISFHKEEGSHVDDEVLWRADGSSFDAEYRSFPMYRHGEIIGSVVSFTDVSDRKKLEKEKQLSEDRLRNFFNVSREGILFHDNGTVLDVNSRIEEMFGYASDEIVGHSMLELSTPESRQELTEIIATGVASGGDQEFRTTGLHKDGSKLHIEGYSSTQKIEGNKTIRVVSISDVTTRMESEALHRTLVNTMRDGLITINERGFIDSINPAAEIIFGYSAAEILGKNVTLLMPDSYKSKHIQGLQKYLTTGESNILNVPGVDVEGVGKDGRRFPLSITVSEMYIGGTRFFGAVIRDMTEKVALEKKQEHLAAELTQLIDTANAPIFGIDTTGKVSIWNQTATRLTGYESDDIIGHDLVQEFITDDYKKSVKEVLDNALKGIETANYEFPLYSKGGKRLEILLNASARRNLDGDIIGVIGIGQDITLAKSAQAEQERVAAELTQLIDTANAPIFSLDDNLQVNEWNQSIARITGYDKEEAMDCLFIDEFISDIDRESVNDIFSIALQGEESANFELKLNTRAGKMATILFNTTTRRDLDGNVTGVIGIGHDMTSSLLAEAKAQQFSGELSLLVDMLDVPIFSFSSSGEIVEWNKDLADLSGYSREEMVGVKWTMSSFPQMVAEDQLEDITEIIFRAFSGSPKDKNIELTMIRKDGARRQLLLNLTSRKNTDNKIVGVFGVIQDVTELREKESALNQAQKMEAIGQLTGGIAHDFNNLLSIVKGNLRFLQQDIGEVDSSINELFEDAMSAVDDGAELTQRLLGFSRRGTLHPQINNVGDTIEKFTRFLSRTLGERVELRFEPAGTELKINVDPSQLENALLNVSLNARDAMPEGGLITITTARYHHHDLSGGLVLPLGHYIRISVTDNGSGISEEDLQHVYEPFFTTKDLGKGSGLGLSMVYGFMQQSNGTCHISSTLGEGTTISLYFPEVPGAVQGRGKDDSIARGPTSGSETILVVEDEPRVRRVTLRDLNKLGYKTLEAENADVARAIIESGEPVDLLFSDVLMPGKMDGHMLGMWTEENYPQIKVILTSGYSRGRADVSADKAHPFMLIRKPYSIDKLAEEIRSKLSPSES